MDGRKSTGDISMNDEERAAKDAELEAATATFEDECAAHQDTLRLLAIRDAEIARLQAALIEYANSLEISRKAGFDAINERDDVRIAKDAEIARLLEVVSLLVEELDDPTRNNLTKHSAVWLSELLRAKARAALAEMGKA
jgi:hypothetical protein